MHNKSVHIALWMVALAIMAGCRGSLNPRNKAEVDALNARAYAFRYVDIDSVSALVNQALTLSDKYPDGHSEAHLNLAFVKYQQMDFDAVDSILRLVRNDNHNQLILLCADVMQMKTCQRTGDGSRFFQAKSSAETRMKRILEEQDEITPRDMSMWVFAQTEFYIIVSTYYVYQEQYAMAEDELRKVLSCLDMHADTAQWIYYNYMLGPGGLVSGDNEDDIALQEFDYLFQAYILSHRTGIRYFEANSLQAIASMFLNHDSLIRAKRPEAFQLFSSKFAGTDDAEPDLPLALARQALSLFMAYNDLFQTACTYRTLGEICFARGLYDKALEHYDHALHLVNVHHLRYYGSVSSDTLSAFNPDDLERSVEKEWMTDARISTVPDWIAGIRQQYSLAYSALGMRQKSDYNRNLYLDLIQATNQNLEWESRTDELERQTASLYERMRFCLLLMGIALVLFLIFRYRLKRQSRNNIQELDKALDLFSAQDDGKDSHESTSVDTPFLKSCKEFVAWNRAEIAALEDEKEDLEEKLQMNLRRMADSKRRNAENRAKVSLVHAIVPFLDRIGGEVVRMKKENEVGPARQEYIVELVGQIEAYNAILTDWIKMEQGQLSLHITTFPLQRLFKIIAEGRYSFDQKQIRLNVAPVEASVKADESLTLFMINTLCDNARKFTPQGGEVTLSAQETEDYVEISVADTGVGLSPTDVDTLNNSKVYDASAIGVGESNKGFGFGLMNCRGIIEKYKKLSSLFACCDFRVRSTQGEGSVFSFRLPRVVRLLMLLLALPLAVHAEADETLYYDSLYQANVDGRFEATLHHAAQVIRVLNEAHPKEPALMLVDSVHHHQEAPDLLWAKAGVDTDYDLIVGLRNELALAALALHDWPLYRYNNDVCIRLHRYINQDNSLPSYFRKLEQTHQNSNLMLVFIILASIVILVLFYKLLVRGPVEKEREIDELKQYLLRMFDVARTKPQLQEFQTATADCPSMKKRAVEYQTLVGQQSVQPIQSLQNEEVRLRDELARIGYEENRLYVQNQILDNCLSTIKHESMYYPSRIRVLTERMQNEDIGHLSELVQYYHHIYTLLCKQADEQVSQPGFKRQHLVAQALLQGCATIAQRLGKRMKMVVQPLVIDKLSPDAKVIADESLLNVMLESLFAGMLHEKASIEIEAGIEDGFVCFVLRDRSLNLSDDELANLFFPDAHHISYLVAKQILREHDTYLNHPGCRLNARKAEGGGYEIYFTLLIHNS